MGGARVDLAAGSLQTTGNDTDLAWTVPDSSW
jgi:flagellar basal body rod protein FlgG